MIFSDCTRPDFETSINLFFLNDFSLQIHITARDVIALSKSDSVMIWSNLLCMGRSLGLTPQYDCLSSLLKSYKK